MQLLPENETSCPHADGRGISPAGRKTPGVYRLSVSARHGRAAAASAAASASGDRPCARLFRVALTTNGTLLPARQALLLAAPALYKINISLHSFEANVAGSFDDYLSGCFTFAKLAAETGKARGPSSLESGWRDDARAAHAERRHLSRAGGSLSAALDPKHLGFAALRARVRPLRGKNSTGPTSPFPSSAIPAPAAH